MALAYLRSANRAGPKLYVRVNALDTGLTLGDLAVVMQGRPDGIVFPKCVGQADLDLLANYLDALEAREGIDAGTTKILTIATESAAAVLALDGSAGQACAPDGPFVGRRGSDGRSRRAGQGPRARRLRRHFQAGAHRQPDGVGGGRRHRLRHGLSRHQESSRACAPRRTTHERMGYGGKIAIHPDQVAIIHEVFTPIGAGDRLGQARRRHLREQPGLRRADARRQDARPAAPRAGAPPARTRGRMSDTRRAAADARSAVRRAARFRSHRSTAFLEGLESRSYAFAIAALNLPNCVPTGIPWLSTITGVPMFLLVVQYFPADRCPRCRTVVGRRGLPRGQAAGFPRRACSGTSNGWRTPFIRATTWWVTRRAAAAAADSPGCC